MLNSEDLIRRLAGHAPVFRALGETVSAEQASWKPSPDKWSALEVVNHLWDEEREDFRTRLDLTLHHPESDWPGIDPAGWVLSRGYAQREFLPSLEIFLEERETSVRWLRGLRNPDWEMEHRHPLFGAMRAGDLLASWVAHDLLHLRQLVRLQHQYLAGLSEPFSMRYAGEW